MQQADTSQRSGHESVRFRLKVVRWLRSPLVHFFGVGLGLFILEFMAGGGGVELLDDRTIVVSAAHVAELEAVLRQGGLGYHEGMLKAEIDKYVAEEVMVREARRMSMDRGDMIIRRRLIQKMDFLVDEMTQANEPSEDELKVWFVVNAARYLRPARYNVEHVYFARERRGSDASQDASAALRAWQESGEAPSGDPFLGGLKFNRRTHRALTRQVDSRFADAVVEVAGSSERDQWSGPVETTYGHHLVRVISVRESSAASFAAVRARVRRDMLMERRQQESARARAALIDSYNVIVKEPR